jgi:hypothetical protein
MTAVVCVVWPATARAQSDFLDWLQPGSGPGPFRSYGRGVFVRLLCVTEPERARYDVTSCIADTNDNIKVVVEAQYAFTPSVGNPRFNDPAALLEPQNSLPLNIQRFDVNYSYRVSPMLDIGVGIGAYIYSGEGFEKQTHLTFTPIQMSLVPLGFLQGETSKKWGRVLRIKYANHRLVGDYFGSDFGSKSTYLTRGEFSQSIIFSADFYAFIVDWLKKR